METNTITHASVLQECARLDALIRSIDHSLLIAQRLKAAGNWDSRWDEELLRTQDKRSEAAQARAQLADALSAANP